MFWAVPFAFASLTLASVLGACAQAPEPASGGASHETPPPLRLSTRTLASWSAAEANQGVAVDAEHLYVVDNTQIGKYRLPDGVRVAGWEGPRRGLVRHLNSCFAEAGGLWCANSNFSLTPMASSIERFRTADMSHAGSHSLGLAEEGSLTWFGRLGDGWIAGFAHYDGNGGVGFKTHRSSAVVVFDALWRRRGGWAFPETVLARLAPDAASGGALGPDGLLYVMGRARPEMYVLARPAMGPVLIHVATLDIEAEGQAFAWVQDPARPDAREVMTIDQHRLLVRRSAVPDVDASGFPGARPFF